MLSLLEALLVFRLMSGYTVTVGVLVAFIPEDLRQAFGCLVGEYEELRLHGRP